MNDARSKMKKSGQFCLPGKLTAFRLTPPDLYPDGVEGVPIRIDEPNRAGEIFSLARDELGV